MKKLIYFILLGSVLFLLGACESDGKFNMVNQTSYPVYTSVDGGAIVTIPAQGNRVFEVETGSQSFLTGEVSKRISVYVVGETFSLYDKDENKYVDDTIVTVRAGKTTNAYLAPNRASIKIVNNSAEDISLAEIRQIAPTTNLIVETLHNIPAGASHWERVKHASLQDSFTYRVVVYLEGGGSPLIFDAPTVLAKDEQWLIHVEPLDSK